MLHDRAESILRRFDRELGVDAVAYRNHVRRVIEFCTAFHRDADEDDRDKIAIAAAFHDLGIWTSGTFDYLAPSVALAKDFLREHDLERWSDEIGLMIDQHHGLRPRRDMPLVEAFRKSDLVDVSLGIVKCGLPRAHVAGVRAQYPNAGFHRLLVQLAARWFVKHPLNPLPVLKW